MGAVGQVSLHFPFFPVEHLLDLFRVNRFCCRIGHLVFHVTGSFPLPGSGPLCETVFIPDEETVEEEKEHVPELREWEGDEHRFS